MASDSAVYAQSYGSYVWLCKPCQAWVGVHRNSPNHTPLGRLANAELRKLKVEAHGVFDLLWQAAMKHRRWSKGRARRLAYRWLGRELEIPQKDCHIGFMGPEDTRRVIRLCQAVIEKRHTPQFDACNPCKHDVESTAKAD